MTAQSLIAIYAAVVATAALGWNILRDSRDRASVRINAAGMPQPGKPATYRELLVFLSNKGRRNVILTGLAIRGHINGKRGTMLVIQPDFPMELKEGEIRSVECGDLAQFAGGVPDRIVALSSKGQKWKARKREIQKTILRSEFDVEVFRQNFPETLALQKEDEKK